MCGKPLVSNTLSDAKRKVSTLCKSADCWSRIANPRCELPAWVGVRLALCAVEFTRTPSATGGRTEKKMLVQLLFAPALGAQRCPTLPAHHPNPWRSSCPRGREAAARTPAACLPRHSPRRSPELLCSAPGPFIIAFNGTVKVGNQNLLVTQRFV